MAWVAGPLGGTTKWGKHGPEAGLGAGELARWKASFSREFKLWALR